MTGMVRGKGGALPDLNDRKMIKKMMDKVTPDKDPNYRPLFGHPHDKNPPPFAPDPNTFGWGNSGWGNSGWSDHTKIGSPLLVDSTGQFPHHIGDSGLTSGTTATTVGIDSLSVNVTASSYFISPNSPNSNPVGE